VAKVYKLYSNDYVQIVMSMIGLNDVRSLVAKRRSQFLCSLNCVSFFQTYTVLHSYICSLLNDHRQPAYVTLIISVMLQCNKAFSNECIYGDRRIKACSNEGAIAACTYPCSSSV